MAEVKNWDAKTIREQIKNKIQLRDSGLIKTKSDWLMWNEERNRTITFQQNGETKIRRVSFKTARNAYVERKYGISMSGTINDEDDAFDKEWYESLPD